MYKIIEKGKVTRYRVMKCYVCDCVYEASSMEFVTLTHRNTDSDGNEHVKVEAECRCPECRSFNFVDVTKEAGANPPNEQGNV